MIAMGQPAAGNNVLRNEKGFSLMELIVVMVIMGILTTIAALSYRSMGQRYDVEKQVKQMFSDLLGARLGAAHRQRDQFFSLVNTTRYRVYEDGPTPDGDFKFNTADDTLIMTRDLLPSYSIVSIPTITLVQFTSKGLVSDSTPAGTIRIDPTVEGEYDCIVIEKIKTGMGKWNGAKCLVK